MHWWLWAEANRKSAMESRLKHTKMSFHSILVCKLGLSSGNHNHYFFSFAFQPLRAEMHKHILGLTAQDVWSYFLFCISGRKARNAYTSQAVRPEMWKASQGVSPEMRVLFFWPTFLFKKKSWYTKLHFQPKLRFGVKMKSFHCKFTVKCKHLTVLHWLRQCSKFAMEVSCAALATPMQQ